MARYDYFRYNKQLKKTFKPGKARFFCHVSDDGTVYICNSYAVYELSPAEYREFVQPSTCCEPGHWCIETDGQKHEIPATDFDFIKMFHDAVNDPAPRFPVSRAPFNLPGQNKETVAGFYSKAADFVTVLNDAYIGVFDDGMRYETSSSMKPVIVYWGDMPISMVLPIRWTSNNALLRSVRAYFIDESETAEKLREERRTNERLCETVSNQDAIISRQDARIAELEKELAEAQQGREDSPALDAEERRAALERLNHAQNAANEFYNITDDDIAAEAKRAKNAAEAPQTSIAILPAFHTFTLQTGPRTISTLEKTSQSRSRRLIMRRAA